MLTVAVSVAAGIAAVTSAVPGLLPYRVWLGVLTLSGIAVANLRGLRESGRLVAAPTYLFVVSVLGLVGYGFVGALLGLLPAAPYEPHPPGLEGIGLVLLLRAFAAGCTALTGIEAVSDGVPAADDYVSKPFGPAELLARIRVALRHAAGAARDEDAVFTVGTLHVDLAHRRVAVAGHDVHDPGSARALPPGVPSSPACGRP